MKRVSFKTIGCRLNQAETAQMAARFKDAGYCVVPFGRPSEVCVIHTCMVTRSAEKTCARLARSAKRSHGNPIVVLAGCAVEVDGNSLREESGADILAGQKDKFRLPELVSGLGRDCELSSIFPAEKETPILPHFHTTRALIKVQDGCNFRCAYCIVPFARGHSRSRPFEEIINEVKGLADAGFREVVLTGANLACYEDGPMRLTGLLERIEAIERIDRIRLSSIEVSTTERVIIDYMAQSEKLCRYIHLPLQSGDDRILSAMGRRYTAKEYCLLIEYVLKKISLPGLGTDLVAGLPGEDEAAFAKTVRMIQDIPFSNLHVFPYSKRAGTKAAVMRCQVPEDEKKRRTAHLIEIGMKKKQSFAEQFIGRKVSVLVERVTEGKGGTGWTGEYLEARVNGNRLMENQIIKFTPRLYDGKMLS